LAQAVLAALGQVKEMALLAAMVQILFLALLPQQQAAAVVLAELEDK
jgi:hypothetical protein